MPSKKYPVSKRTVELTSYSLVMPFEWICPGCGQSLEIHQPDPANPDRLLAACTSCTAWHVVDLAAGMMMLVPS